MRSGYADVWQVLRDNSHRPLSYNQIRDLVHSRYGTVEANIGTVVSRLTKAGILECLGRDELRSYFVNEEWKQANLWDAAPKNLGGKRRAKGQEDWGTHMSLPVDDTPVVGDIIIITTGSGKVFYPRRLVSIEDNFPKLDVINYVCRTEELRRAKRDDPDAELAALEKKIMMAKAEADDLVAMDQKAAEDDPKAADILDKIAADPMSGDDAQAMLELLASEMAQVVKQQVDDAVRRALKPMVLEVVTPNAPKVVIDGGHYLLPRLIQLVAAGFNPFLWGPPGTGKTTAAEMVAQALSRLSEIDTLDPTTARSMIQGYKSPTGEPVHTSFTRCWINGLVYIADEVDLAPGHVQTLNNSALAQRTASLAWGNVKAHKNFAFVATGNTPGRPTAAFPDRRPMSNAFADRLYFMHWPLDPTIEARAVGVTPPTLPRPDQETCDPKQWYRFVTRLRDYAARQAPTLQVTPRATLLGIRALAIGESPSQVADALIFRGCDAEMKAKALRNVRW